jgi:hypothetical protein
MTNIDIMDQDIELEQRTQIEIALTDIGLSGPILRLGVMKIESLFEEMIWTSAGVGLANVLSTLGESPFAEAIRRKLLRDETPLRSAAEQIGCSHEGLRKAESRLQELLVARLVDKGLLK